MPQALSSVDSISRIFHDIPDLATPPQVEQSLRAILEDPSLELAWWDWERGLYVGVDGEPADLAVPGERAVTRVEYESRRIGAILHDPRLLDVPDFLGVFVPMMRIAMERDRLHRDLTAKLEQLRASRARLAETADAERRRLERNLHDGAQQRLVTALLQLRGLETRLDEGSEQAAALAAARAELEAGIADLRELARGLHPPLLSSHGLEAAVRGLVARSTVPVEAVFDLPGEVPPAVGAAAYYVCAEALANTSRHADAASARVRAVLDEAALTLEVTDDGVGGASLKDAEGSTGLPGLRDRVEALGGTLALESRPGRGTRIAARFPLRPA